MITKICISEILLICYASMHWIKWNGSPLHVVLYDLRSDFCRLNYVTHNSPGKYHHSLAESEFSSGSKAYRHLREQTLESPHTGFTILLSQTLHLDSGSNSYMHLREQTLESDHGGFTISLLQTLHLDSGLEPTSGSNSYMHSREQTPKWAHSRFMISLLQTSHSWWEPTSGSNSYMHSLEQTPKWDHSRCTISLLQTLHPSEGFIVSASCKHLREQTPKNAHPESAVVLLHTIHLGLLWKHSSEQYPDPGGFADNSLIPLPHTQ